MTRSYRALLLDLFGTVVHFRSSPTAAPAFTWLREPLARVCPGLALEPFVEALVAVSQEIAAARAPDYREVPSSERFRRALGRLMAAVPAGAARTLSLAHMAHLSAQTELPAGHAALLRELAGHHRLALVSNFDHAPTARAILERFALVDCFGAVVISDEHGRRKPHPAIFRAALARLAVDTAATLYVGDSVEEDVVGARAVGLDVAWIDRRGRGKAEPPPTYVLPTLPDLRALL